MQDSLPFAKKSLGQHWLADEAALRAMCDAAEVGPDDTVLEIGPGVATLTKKLAARAGQVVAVEFDEKLARELSSRVSVENLQVVHQDILSFDLTTLPLDYKVAANIPYYLTSKLLRVLLESSNPPLVSALLVQKEVAERVTAAPGAMSLLSVSVQYYADVSLGDVIPRRLFTPPPKVDSQILILHRREAPLFPDADTKQFFRVVKAGFAARRKTLLNSLAGGMRMDKAAVTEWLDRAGINPQSRPQELSLHDWHTLSRFLPESKE